MGDGSCRVHQLSGADSHSYGALLYTELVRRFGEDHVFLDAESIPAGADFVEELLARVRSALVLLAVIGPRWRSATDPAGRRRIDDPEDWIRRELAEAFAAGVRVIPVLTELAELPTATELPAEIGALSRCQFRRLRYREPTADLARIVTDLVSVEPVPARAARSRVGAPSGSSTPAAMFSMRGDIPELCRTSSRSWRVAGGAIHASGSRFMRNRSARSAASRTSFFTRR